MSRPEVTRVLVAGSPLAGSRHMAVRVRCGGCAQAELLMCTWAALEAGFLLKLKADFQLSVLPLCQLPSLSLSCVRDLFFFFFSFGKLYNIFSIIT